MPDDALPPDSFVGRMLNPLKDETGSGDVIFVADKVDNLTWDSPKEFRAKGAWVSGADGKPIAEFVFAECTMKDGETYRLTFDEESGTVRVEPLP